MHTTSALAGFDQRRRITTVVLVALVVLVVSGSLVFLQVGPVSYSVAEFIV